MIQLGAYSWNSDIVKYAAFKFHSGRGANEGKLCPSRGQLRKTKRSPSFKSDLNLISMTHFLIFLLLFYFFNLIFKSPK